MSKSKDEDSWRNNLLCSDKGAPKPLLANAITALRDCPAWMDVLAYDELSMQAVAAGVPPWDVMSVGDWCERPWSPNDDVLTTDWLQRHGIGVNTATAAQAVETVARDRSFHPVVNYLESLRHDGVARLNGWIARYLGAEQNDYHATVGRCALIAAVARIYSPGSKVDTMPILEGVQGARKSTAIRTLFDPWFTDELADFGSKDAAMQTRGVWGVEVSELDSMSRGEISGVKAFITRTTDRFRPPYGNRVIEAPRSCVFWGTTNKDDYLKDETGGRRFWPIKVGKIDIDGLTEWRDQLWAEAVVLFKANVPWWITKDDMVDVAEAEQRKRYIGDPWDEVVAVCVAGVNEVSLNSVLQAAAGADHARWSQVEMNRVARILQSMGFRRVQRRIGEKRIWIYRRVVPIDVSGTNVTTLRPVTNPGDGCGTTSQAVTPDGPVTREMPAGRGPAPSSPQSPLF